MPPFRFVHTADLHIDSPFRGLSEVAPSLQSVMQNATFEAFARIVQLCVEKHVDFLIIAGDVYDATDRNLRALTRLRQAFEQLADHQIEVFVCHGNHDPLSGWGAQFSWPDNVTIFGAEAVEACPVLKNGVEVARVYGISYAVERITDNLARAFRKETQAPWSIGVLHTNVGNNPYHLNYAPCQLDDLLASGMDYWALGHVHAHRVLHEANPVVIYPGNPQGRHPRESGPRGCYLVEVDAMGQALYEFVPVDVVRWHEERVCIEGLRTFGELLAALDMRVDALQQSQERQGSIVRWKLEGRGPLHRELARPGRLEDLLATIREKWGGGPHFVWSESIEDETSREVDRTALEQEENLLGDFLRLAGHAEPALVMELQEAVRPLFHDPRFRRYLSPPTQEQIRAWVHAAQWQGIDRLLAGDE
ncbi:MAG: DNA repair exonuclease [Nitrospirae bacterium]|nr:MAG: DNA repair exonuclease [Nitrospirota bacterium]